jgi:hypothetical protein
VVHLVAQFAIVLEQKESRLLVVFVLGEIASVRLPGLISCLHHIDVLVIRANIQE